MSPRWRYEPWSNLLATVWKFLNIHSLLIFAKCCIPRVLLPFQQIPTCGLFDEVNRASRRRVACFEIILSIFCLINSGFLSTILSGWNDWIFYITKWILMKITLSFHVPRVMNLLEYIWIILNLFICQFFQNTNET